MMEFTLSRVALAVAGIALLAAIVPTMSAVYDERVETASDSHAETVAEMFDSFASSSAQTMTVNAKSFLPGADASLTLEGHIVTVEWGGKSWTKGMRVCESDGKYVITGGDYVKFTKNGGVVSAEILG